MSTKATPQMTQAFNIIISSLPKDKVKEVMDTLNSYKAMKVKLVNVLGKDKYINVFIRFKIRKSRVLKYAKKQRFEVMFQGELFPVDYK